MFFKRYTAQRKQSFPEKAPETVRRITCGKLKRIHCVIYGILPYVRIISHSQVANMTMGARSCTEKRTNSRRDQGGKEEKAMLFTASVLEKTMQNRHVPFTPFPEHNSHSPVYTLRPGLCVHIATPSFIYFEKIVITMLDKTITYMKIVSDFFFS